MVCRKETLQTVSLVAASVAVLMLTVSPAGARECTIACALQKAATSAAARQAALACRQRCAATASGPERLLCLQRCGLAYRAGKADSRSAHASCRAVCSPPQLEVPTDNSCLAACGRGLAGCAREVIALGAPCVQGCRTSPMPIACVSGCAGAARESAERCAAMFSACARACAPQTPLPTVDPEPTPTPTASVTRLSCDIRGQAVIKAMVPRLGTLSASIPLSGSQVWEVGGADAHGVRAITLPPASSHFNCAESVVVGQRVSLCARLDPRAAGGGGIDCNGGNLTGYNITLQTDHRNPSLQAVESGVFPPGGVLLASPVLLRPGAGCNANPCPADNAPFDPALDLEFSGSITSGRATAKILNANNVKGQTLQASATGNPFSCQDAIGSHVLSQGALAGAYPAVDQPLMLGVSGDAVATLVVGCR